MSLPREDWVLPAEARSAARARALISQRLADLPAESLEVVLLLTSELITNAVRHARGPVGLHLAWSDRDVRVEVEDQSPERPVVRPINRDSLNGRGLLLVDGLANGWGVKATDTGKRVWFSLEG